MQEEVPAAENPEDPVAENPDTPAAENPEGTEAKVAKPKRRGNRGPRKPSFKDWVRVIKSAGNTVPNKTLHLIINEATNICTLVTDAPAKEDAPEGEMEGERRQIFKITSHEVVNIPDEPEAASEAAPEPETAPAPPAGD